MKWVIVLFSVMFVFMVTPIMAQSEDQIDMEFVISNQDLILLFVIFIISIIGIAIFLARDIILRKKNPYDDEDLESKKDKTYEKYHSDWGDDYEEIGNRKNTTKHEDVARIAQNSELPNYYKILDLPRDATQEEIKQQYRKLAKKSHPDRTGDEESKKIMAEINKAYEVLSDVELRAGYDKHLDGF